MGVFIQKEAITYSGSAKEEAITLNRGSKWDIKEVRITAADAAAGSYIQLLRKASASTANERDDSHDDSAGVLIAEGYTSNGDIVFDFSDASRIGHTNMSSTALRLYLSLGSSSMTVYVNIKYVYV